MIHHQVHVNDLLGASSLLAPDPLYHPPPQLAAPHLTARRPRGSPMPARAVAGGSGAGAGVNSAAGGAGAGAGGAAGGETTPSKKRRIGVVGAGLGVGAGAGGSGPGATGSREDDRDETFTLGKKPAGGAKDKKIGAIKRKTWVLRLLSTVGALADPSLDPPAAPPHAHPPHPPSHSPSPSPRLSLPPRRLAARSAPTQAETGSTTTRRPRMRCSPAGRAQRTSRMTRRGAMGVLRGVRVSRLGRGRPWAERGARAGQRRARVGSRLRARGPRRACRPLRRGHGERARSGRPALSPLLPPP